MSNNPQQMVSGCKFSDWLHNSITESSDKKYRHRLFKEHSGRRSDILSELTRYIQNAHDDARKRLKKLTENSLDPLGAKAPFDPAEGYPNRFHMNTLQGYFGEIFAGLIAEHFSPFDDDGWKVPVYLFRFHGVEFQQLEILRQSGGVAKKRTGRTGDDCLAFKLDNEGKITCFLYCEAKCTSGGRSKKMIAAAYQKASESVLVDLPQIIEVLQLRFDVHSQQWLYAIQELWFQSPNYKAERRDIVSYVCGKSPVLKGLSAWLPTDNPHEAYTAKRRLEAVEIHLPDLVNLVREVYHKQDDGEILTGGYISEDEEDDFNDE
jgi:hypothetical protein